jgi:hypothetical protein
VPGSAAGVLRDPGFAGAVLGACLLAATSRLSERPVGRSSG